MERIINNEDLVYNVLLQMDVEDILVLCNLNNKTFKICHTKQFWVDKLYPYNVDYVFEHLSYLPLALKINKFIMGKDPNFMTPNKSYIVFTRDNEITLKHYYKSYYSSVKQEQVLDYIIELLITSNKFTAVYYIHKTFKEYDFYNINDLEYFLDHLPLAFVKEPTFDEESFEYEDEVSFEYEEEEY
jgi:hypothetical protein